MRVRPTIRYALLGLSLIVASGTVHAEARAETTAQNSEERRTDTNSILIGRMDMRQDQLDNHLTATDTRVNDQGTKIAVMQGIGGSIIGVLTFLNLLGQILNKKAAVSHS
jgi:hypothetical protein